MRRKVIFALEARLEFEDAVSWYNEREAGLGLKFETEVDAAIRRILENPEHFPLRGKKVRKSPVKTFDKYIILFRVEVEFIFIAAVFHGARNPANLRRRLD